MSNINVKLLSNTAIFYQQYDNDNSADYKMLIFRVIYLFDFEYCGKFSILGVDKKKNNFGCYPAQVNKYSPYYILLFLAVI